MNSSRHAFSLLELLAVIAIVAVLSVLVVPSFTHIAAGNALTRGAQVVADQVQLARQIAAGRNRDVQVRFVWRDDEPAGYRGVQLWSSSPTNVTEYVPLSRIAWLPEGTLISSSAELSPLIAHSPIPETTADFPGRGPTKFCGFRFRASGRTDLNFNSANDYVTVVRGADAEATAAPPNCAIVQVDPVNGHVRTYRP
jgi:uncharacterized protein (TIGR02596 family)